MRCKAADFAAYTNPFGNDFEWNDQDRAWDLIVRLQVHLIPRSKVGTVHQFLGYRNLPVQGNSMRAVWRVHEPETTNICSIVRGRTSAFLGNKEVAASLCRVYGDRTRKS